MAAKLKVLRNGLVVDEHEIKKQTVLIGKGDHCDLVLNFPGVGREMARLTAEQDGFFLTDISVQGVFVNGQRITQQKILPGQEINCGSVQMQLVDEGALGDDSSGSSSATMLWGASGMAPVVKATPAVLVVKDQPGRTYELSGEEFVIGRRPELCKLALPDKAVSSRHARIAKAGHKYLLADLNSTNGTLLNGAKPNEPVELKDGDEIRIGKTTFTFHAQATPGQPPPQAPALPEAPQIIDIRKIALQSTELTPAVPEGESENKAKAATATARKRRVLLLGFVFVLVLMIMVIALTRSQKPTLDPARLNAVQALIQEGKLEDAGHRLAEIEKGFPADPRVRQLKGQLADAVKQAGEKSVAELVDQARAKEASMDIAGAVDLWAEVLAKTPDNSEIQKKLCYTAYRIALVYEGKSPDADKTNAIKYLEMIEKLVEKENGPDYAAAVKLLVELKK
ncbi:MAG: FHA domain-containing protein [Acidobacteria bacterium]|nr:FHA domain-containing protein [Acidobacteriota bacterium]